MHALLLAGAVALLAGSAPLRLEVAPSPFPYVVDGARYPVPVVLEGRVTCPAKAPGGASITVRLDGALGWRTLDLGPWTPSVAKPFRMGLEAPVAGPALYWIRAEARGIGTALEAFAVPRVPAHPLLRGAVRAGAAFRFVHMTDTHIRDRDGVYSGVATARNLALAVEEVNALDPPPAFAVVTGDVVFDEARGYPLAIEILSGLRVPFVILPGNHDFPKAVPAASLAYASLGLPFSYAFDAGRWHFVCLNAQSDPAETPVEGEIDPIQLAWLERDLRATGRPTMVFVHQSPVLGAFQRGQGIRNAADLRRVLESSGHVRWCFCGHVHFDTFIEARGIRYVSTAATAYPFRAKGYRDYRTGSGWRLVDVDGETVRTRFKAIGGAWEDDPAPARYLPFEAMRADPMIEYPDRRAE